jgi:peptidyl-prolyl cis-trans isomerase SurA
MRLCAAILLLASLGARAEVVDRVAISVGQQVVTESEIRRQIRRSAFFSNSEPDFSPAARKLAAEQLIDQALIRREIELTKYAPVPMAEVNERMEEFKARRNLTQEQFQASLTKVGFEEADFKEELLWQLTLLRFIDFRFRPSIQVSEAEVRDYYDKTFVPQFKKANPGVEPPPVEQVQPRIQAVVASEKSNTTLFRWLQQSRQQVRIKFFEEAFR